MRQFWQDWRSAIAMAAVVIGAAVTLAALPADASERDPFNDLWVAVDGCHIEVTPSGLRLEVLDGAGNLLASLVTPQTYTGTGPGTFEVVAYRADGYTVGASRLYEVPACEPPTTEPPTTEPPTTEPPTTEPPTTEPPTTEPPTTEPPTTEPPTTEPPTTEPPTTEPPTTEPPTTEPPTTEPPTTEPPTTEPPTTEPPTTEPDVLVGCGPAGSGDVFYEAALPVGEWTVEHSFGSDLYRVTLEDLESGRGYALVGASYPSGDSGTFWAVVGTWGDFVNVGECSPPPADLTPPPAEPELPRTGRDLPSATALGLALLSAGVVAVRASRQGR